MDAAAVAAQRWNQLIDFVLQRDHLLLDKLDFIVAQVVDNRGPQFQDPLLHELDQVASEVIDPIRALFADGLHAAAHILGVPLLEHVACDFLQFACHFLPHLFQSFEVGEGVVLLVDWNVVSDALGTEQLDAV